MVPQNHLFRFNPLQKPSPRLETVGIGVLTGLALCCFVARMVIRLTYQKALRLDDAFLILAAACLCVATGILYHICYFLYLHSAALLAPQVLPYVLANYGELLSLQKKVYPFLAMIWTTTFAVKGCFLAFMRPLVWHISRAVNRYYWFIVVFCVMSWAFVMVDPFIICPYFGEDAVVSLPIIILRGSFLSRSTKIGLAIFLCLSIFMAICAAVRMAGFYYKGLEDDVWEFFWQHIEGDVAVMMASITAFRTLFVKQTSTGNGNGNGNNAAQEETIPLSPMESLWNRLWRRFQSLARAQPDEKPTTMAPNRPLLKLPKIPSPVFTGVRTFIRGSNRTDASAATFVTLESVSDATEADYHAALKTQTRAASGNTSTKGQSRSYS
ncbi:hypothetical protein SLS62_004966 [Diatrype stigma]|uniref:Rhodopsin domain-containing protein n=1 Tax=Diatrype stigma TaxID=117547 RepID=A0AAN9YSK6_9PEZI